MRENHHVPTKNGTHNPRMCPNLETNQQPFWCTGLCSTNWATLASTSLFLYSIVCLLISSWSTHSGRPRTFLSYAKVGQVFLSVNSPLFFFLVNTKDKLSYRMFHNLIIIVSAWVFLCWELHSRVYNFIFLVCNDVMMNDWLTQWMNK